MLSPSDFHIAQLHFLLSMNVKKRNSPTAKLAFCILNPSTFNRVLQQSTIKVPSSPPAPLSFFHGKKPVYFSALKSLKLVIILVVLLCSLFQEQLYPEAQGTIGVITFLCNLTGVLCNSNIPSQALLHFVYPCKTIQHLICFQHCSCILVQRLQGLFYKQLPNLSHI